VLYFQKPETGPPSASVHSVQHACPMGLVFREGLGRDKWKQAATSCGM